MYKTLNETEKGSKKVLVNKGALLSEVRVATVPKCKSNVKGVWVEGYILASGLEQ